MKRLAGMGCPVLPEQVITSGDVMIQYLKENYLGKRIFLAGTPDLEQNFYSMGSSLPRICRMPW